MKVKTYDKAKGKYVYAGDLEGDTYTRKVNNRHYMVKEHGYGVQRDVLEKLISDSVRYIVIQAKQKTYKTTLATWVSRGKVKDYGHGEQVFLNTNFMEEVI